MNSLNIYQDDAQLRRILGSIACKHAPCNIQGDR